MTYQEYSQSRSAGESLYKYNGKEKQKEWDVLDFNTRMHDPALGRFMGIDLLADKYALQSPYAYAANNPISYVDILGMGPGDGDQKPKKEQEGDSWVAEGIVWLIESNLEFFRQWGENTNRVLGVEDATTEEEIVTGVQTVVDIAAGHTELLLHPPGSSVSRRSRRRASKTPSLSRNVSKMESKSYVKALKDLDLIKIIGAGDNLPDRTDQIAAKVTSKFKNLECIECANALAKEFKKNGIHGEVIQYHAAVDGRKVSTPIHSDAARNGISASGLHRGVLVNGRVYDNVHKTGISYENWIKDFFTLAPGYIVETIKTF